MSESATTEHPTHPARSWRGLRSIGAVLAGVLANIVIVGAIDSALRATGVYPPMFRPMAERLWALALSYRLAVAVLGGLLTARLAPSRPMRHVTVLAGIETALTVSFVLANWNKPDFGPHWFGIIAAVCYVPLTALGGVLWAGRVARAHRVS
jgi:hypothetical protein